MPENEYPFKNELLLTKLVVNEFCFKLFSPCFETAEYQNGISANILG